MVTTLAGLSPASSSPLSGHTLRPPPTPTRLASTSRLITGYRSHRSDRTAQSAGPGRASPVPAATIRTFRALYAGESFTAALPGSSPLPWPSPFLAGLGTPSPHPQRAGRLTTRQASLHVTDRSVAHPANRDARRWASTPPVSRRHRQPATGPPDSYPDRTYTGKRRRAYESAINHLHDQPPTLWTHCRYTLAPIFTQRIRPQSGLGSGELVAELAIAPPGDGDGGQVGLAEYG